MSAVNVQVFNCSFYFSEYVEEYNRNIVNTEEMEKEIEQYMAAYDAEEVERKNKEKEAGEEDEEGWITVTKG